MLNFFRKKRRIGFVIEKKVSYFQAMASTRLRCYDVIHYLNKHGFIAEVYQPSQTYDVVVFQKCFRQEHFDLAKMIQQRGTSIVLDININIIENYGDSLTIFSNDELESIKLQREDIRKFVSIAAYILVSSFALKDSYKQYHEDVFCIEEIVTDPFFKKIKNHSKIKEKTTLLYVGYAKKAVEIETIKDVLIALRKKNKLEILYLSDQKPEVNIGNVSQRFIKYNQEQLPNLLLEGDIKIAPRNLDNKYNIGHSFTKVAYPMAVGIPAVASPVPSYLNREVILCDNDNDWYNNLEKLIDNIALRSYHGKRSHQFVKNNFSMNRIGEQYVDFLDLITQ